MNIFERILKILNRSVQLTRKCYYTNIFLISQHEKWENINFIGNESWTLTWKVVMSDMQRKLKAKTALENRETRCNINFYPSSAVEVIFHLGLFLCQLFLRTWSILSRHYCKGQVINFNIRNLQQYVCFDVLW